MPELLTYLRSDGVKAAVPEHLQADLGAGPACSIVIPCHDYGAYLEEAVRSALAQTLGAIEVIVVDDGSTDPHTRDVATALIGRQDLKVIFTGNHGVGSARNTGIRAARGRYICCLDADDVLPPSYVEQCVYILEAHRNVGLAYPWLKEFGRSDENWRTRDFQIDTAMHENRTPAGAVYRKADWVLAGGYSESLDIQGYEDWEFWLRIGQLGRTGKVIATELFHRRRHDRSLMDKVTPRRNELIGHMKAANSRLYSDPAWVDAILATAQESDPYEYPSALSAFCRTAASGPRRRVLLVWSGDDASRHTLAEALSHDHDVTCLTTAPAVHGAPERARETFHVPESGLPGGAGAFARYLISTRGIDSVVSAGTPWSDVCAAVRDMQPDVTLTELNFDKAAPGAAYQPERHTLQTVLTKQSRGA